MRHLLAIVACLTFAGPIAHASPFGRHNKAHKKAKHHHKKTKVTPLIEMPDDDVAAEPDAEPVASTEPNAEPEADAEEPALGSEPDSDAPPPRHHHHKRDRVAFEVPLTDTNDRDAAAEETVESDSVDVSPRLHKHAAVRGSNDWHVALGPYLWASSVDANVSLGSASVASGVDFMQISRHARYGAEVLAEARYDRFSVTGDLMYGVVGLSGGTAVGPLMLSVDGEASTLQIEGDAGYRLAGSDQSVLSVEARGGVRYQRTAINGTLEVGTSPIASMGQINGGADAIAGARAFVRPWNRFYASAAFDVGVFGASNTTWSASGDGNVRITSHVLLSVGYRTLTMDRGTVSIVMHGPRAALQFLF